ncbi:DUF2090 domain-containing protein [Cupriavidus sp. WKF15]|uniref:2-deoxy-5-keto-D-gluconate 6-phosphate aldolase domain-containing protein n=1 Tax=Cupriavidus TaxID=106589 RepID=UPI00112CFFDB|nr:MULTISPECIES: DUF2090 domain-containing protein [Cupriavidus]TPQ36140.1 DUF2090 domain-containing protein [Cupriavidus pinatubonensis]WER50479.1 DUF2090 domain-containing protein [Cupriavidus sp. WKF15]
MKLGYDTPLYLLPFDHRQSYVSGMFGFRPPLTPEQRDTIIDSKRLIYEGFGEAIDNGVPASRAGILVDEEFGAAVLRDAVRDGYITAVSVEKSDSDEFEFEYGSEFPRHIEAFRPTFAKVLVRYNPEGNAALNRRQTARLRQLTDYCRKSAQRFMLELLVPATTQQMDEVQADKTVYDLQLRPALMRGAIRVLQDAGIEPDVWKIEGLDCRKHYEELVDLVRRDGRGQVGCIVLGRGADEHKVMNWLEAAAPVPGLIGFAVGRTTFLDAVADFGMKTISRQQAISRIARQYVEWVGIFERASLHDTGPIRCDAGGATQGAIS